MDAVEKHFVVHELGEGAWKDSGGQSLKHKSRV